MSAGNRLTLLILPALALLGAFWLLVLSPKRQDASDLEARAADLQAQVDEQEQLAVAAEAAREDFPRAYRRLAVLGKAAPEDDDTSSLLVQLDRIAAASGVEFVSLTTTPGEAGSTASASAAPQTPADTAQQSEQQAENVEQGEPATPAPAPATEAAAALLPIGATVGPAGLPVMRYSLRFEGDFFRLADFLKGLDDMVRTSRRGEVGVRGRLITVDNFDLSPVGAAGGHPTLNADLTITTYLTPPDQGVTAGASPTGPAAATDPQAAVTAPTTPQPTATASTATP